MKRPVDGTLAVRPQAMQADAVAQLDEEDRRLILMHIYEGQPLEAVAKELDVPRRRSVRRFCSLLSGRALAVGYSTNCPGSGNGIGGGGPPRKI